LARFVRGDVVVIPFPFSDLTQAKRRPAVVVSQLDGNDLILVQVTSQTVRDGHAIPLDSPDFETGSLHKPSNIRPNRVFTADSRIILYKVGRLKKDKTDSVVDKLIEILKK
jgi:mRNA interferase MazF